MLNNIMSAYVTEQLCKSLSMVQVNLINLYTAKKKKNHILMAMLGDHIKILIRDQGQDKPNSSLFVILNRWSFVALLATISLICVHGEDNLL